MITDSKIDLRTSYARALDQAAAWLAERVPDRVPAGLPLELLADPSRLSALATEFGRRVHNRFHEKRFSASETYNAYVHSRLGEDLDELPKTLRDTRLTDRTIEERLDAIARKLERLDNPPATPPLPAHWREIAQDLGVELPTTFESAAERAREMQIFGDSARDVVHMAGLVLTRRLAGALECGDRRAQVAARWFLSMATLPGAPTTESKLLRRVLVGHGLPPVRANDRAWTLEKAAMRWSAGKVEPPDKISSSPDRSLELILEDIGATSLPFPDEAAIRAGVEQREAALERRRKAEADRYEAARRSGKRLADHVFELDEDALRKEERAIREWEVQERAKAHNSRAKRIDEIHLELVTALDRLLEARGARGEIDLAWWWAREARRHLARVPGERGLDETGAVDFHGRLVAWTTFRSFGINLAVKV